MVGRLEIVQNKFVLFIEQKGMVSRDKVIFNDDIRFLGFSNGGFLLL